jgi:hypothetical protein
VSESTIVVLFVAGVVLELAGLALVAWDVWDARRTLTEMSSPTWTYEHPGQGSLFQIMASVAAGNIWRRAVGVGLIAGGLVVQTIANVAAL